MALPAPLDPANTEPARQALARLVRAHQAAIWRYLRFLGCNPGEADDLTQETFLAVAARPIHRFGPDAARAYLRRVARNAFLKSRRPGRAPKLEELDERQAAYDWFRRDDDGDGVLSALRECLRALQDQARRALTLRYAEGAERPQIARELGLSAHGVKSLLQRSYGRLRACVQRRLRSTEAGS